MSVTKQVTIWCDECSVWVPASTTAEQLRRTLRGLGWKQLGRRDLCPKCVPAFEKKKEAT